MKALRQGRHRVGGLTLPRAIKEDIISINRQAACRMSHPFIRKGRLKLISFYKLRGGFNM